MEQASSKAYFMCGSMGQEEFKVFVFDLSSLGDRRSGGVNRCPTVRLNGKVFSRWSFCIIGSTFYGFEGVDTMTNTEGKIIYKYELPLDDEANIQLETYMFTPVCEMKTKKTFPVAVASPNGEKVVVFSYHEDETRTSFELFDPVGRYCTRLYNVPPVPFSNVHIQSHSFISDTEFLLGMDSKMFKLDTKSRKPSWKKVDTFYGGVIPSTYFKVIGNDLCLTKTCAYNIMGLDCGSASYESGEKKEYNSIHRWNYIYPDSSPIATDYEHVAQSIIVLSGGGEGSDLCEFCILKAGENSNIGKGMVTLDVYQCNLFGCRTELLRNSEMEEVQAQEKIEQIRKWRDELPRENPYEANTKMFEYCRKRDSLMGQREWRPLPSTRLKMSSCFTFRADQIFLLGFSSIPTGV